MTPWRRLITWPLYSPRRLALVVVLTVAFVLIIGR
jgi:hypothetical protein